MSGPKIDYVALERERQKKLKEAQDKLTLSLRELYELMEYINNDFSKELSVIDNQYPEMLQTKDLICREKREIISKLVQQKQSKWNEDAETILMNARYISASVVSLKKQYDSAVLQSKEHIKSYIKKRNDINYVSSLFEDIKDNLPESQKHSDNIVFSFIEQTEAHEDAFELIHAISDIFSFPLIHRKRKEWLLDLMEEYNRSQKSDKNFRNMLDAEIADLNREITDIRKLYSWYCSSLEIYNQISSAKLEPCELRDFNDTAELKKSVSDLEKAISSEMADAYIRKQIDEVMKEFGYKTEKSLVFNSASQGTSILYQDNTVSSGIHIHSNEESEDREIMMEVVGVYSSDYAQSSGTNACIMDIEQLTNERIATMLNDQVAFCRKHKDITLRLRERGVILKNKKHFEVSKESLACIAVSSDSYVNVKDISKIRKRHKTKVKAKYKKG